MLCFEVQKEYIDEHGNTALWSHETETHSKQATTHVKPENNPYKPI